MKLHPNKMTSLTLALLLSSLGLPAWGDEFEWWDGKEVSFEVPPVEKTESTLQEQAPLAEPEEPAIIRFGAGASYQLFLRMDDKKTSDRIMSDFSISWAPFGRYGEIGADMSIGRDATFVFRPNLKLFLVNNRLFGLYLEGACDILSMSVGTEFGGGGGLGLIFGLMDNLALEVHAGVTVFDLSDEASMAILGYDEMSDPKAASNLFIQPSVSARIMARF